MASSGSSITAGDTVLVVGGTGGVGQLVTRKLRSRNCNVRITSRDIERAKETMINGSDDDDDDMKNDNVEVVELDLVNGSDEDFITAIQDCNAMVISVGTTAFPTIKWKDGNTPKAIDEIAVSKLAKAAAAAAASSSKTTTMKKIILVTSVGVHRTNEIPFIFLNLFGVLDAKKAGEDAIIHDSGGCNYVIVRPGRLIGGPYTNFDVARLLQIQGGTENGVDIEVGDNLLGDCKRDACAEAIIQSLFNVECNNIAYSIISNEDKALSEDEWTTKFRSMK